MYLDMELEKFATKKQWQKLLSWKEHGTQQLAADALGVARSTIKGAFIQVKSNAAKRGYAPEYGMNHPAADGYKVKGMSTLYDAQTGKAKIQWVKTDQDKERQLEMLDQAIAAATENIPRLKPRPAPTDTHEHLLNCYVITDYHVGMLAWHREGGANWNIDIAQETLMGCFSHLVANSPKAKTAVIAQLGDFLHFDGLEAVTPMHGHNLDADSRFGKLVEIAIKLLRNIIDMALLHHEKVHVIMAEGNHDLASSVWLRKIFGVLYENEPRITVDDSELPYYAYQHGKVMLAFHHGHMKATDALPMYFATSYPEMWGITEFRYAHAGHRHHKHEKEHSGMTVTQHPTLSARDAYAARGGYHAMRQAKVTTYSSKYGQVADSYVTPEMME